MSYLKDSLGPSERIVAEAELPWVLKALAWAALAAGLAVAASMFYFISDTAMAGLAFGLLLFLAVAIFIAIIIPVWSTEIGVTNQRLIVKQGLFTRSIKELELWSVEQVDCKQGMIDQMLDYGHLVISGTGDDELVLPLIANVMAFRKALQQAISDARPGQKPTA